MEGDTDRLLSEKEIINKARERFGLGAVKFEELLRGCTEIKAMPIQITGEDKIGQNDTHDSRTENTTGTTA